MKHLYQHILFESIIGQLIRTIAIRTEGAAGPSGLDAADECASPFMTHYVICAMQLLQWVAAFAPPL